MALKSIRQYRITSLVDVQCRAHTIHRMLSALPNRLIDQGLNRGVESWHLFRTQTRYLKLISSCHGLDWITLVRITCVRVGWYSSRQLARDGNLAKIAGFTNPVHPINVRKGPFLMYSVHRTSAHSLAIFPDLVNTLPDGDDHFQKIDSSDHGCLRDDGVG